MSEVFARHQNVDGCKDESGTGCAKGLWRPGELERVTGVEPATLCLASIRSSQLSYTRILQVFLHHPPVLVNLGDLRFGCRAL